MGGAKLENLSFFGDFPPGGGGMISQISLRKYNGPSLISVGDFWWIPRDFEIAAGNVLVLIDP